MEKKRLYDELEQRGFIAQSSDKNMAKIIEKRTMTPYLGTDPTADSLHVGHLVPIMMLSHFKQHEHNPLLLVGGATGMIGDPSFKSKERNLLTVEQVEFNAEKIKTQVNTILQSDIHKGIQLVNNYDWFKNMDILTFLRDVGKYFSVNNMLVKDSVKNRLESNEQGISFTEFSYSLLQAYDFLYLHEQYGCDLQIGGSDQWGNIVAGIDLVRKAAGGKVYALTCPLITKADGAKFGKTESGTIWLDSQKTTPYEFYQFWMNASDEDVIRFLKLYTFLPCDEIDKIEEQFLQNKSDRYAQKVLAKQVTAMIHGKETMQNVSNTSEILFSDAEIELNEQIIETLSKEIETLTISRDDTQLIDVLASTELFRSKTEVKNLIIAGAITVNNVELRDSSVNLSKFNEPALLIKKGKKNFAMIKFISPQIIQQNNQGYLNSKEILDVSEMDIDLSNQDLSLTSTKKLYLCNNDATKKLQTELLPQNLEKLDISGTNIDISELDLSNTVIKTLILDGNIGTKKLNPEFLPTNLEKLDISESDIDISALDLSLIKIKSLVLDANTGTKNLNPKFLPKNLEMLDISGTEIDLSSLDLFDTKIKKLYWVGTKVTEELLIYFLPHNLEKIIFDKSILGSINDNLEAKIKHFFDMQGKKIEIIGG